MESFNFVLLLILQVSTAQYVDPQQMYQTYNNRNPSVGTGLIDFPSFGPNPPYSPQTDSTYLNGPGNYNGFIQPGSAPGQYPIANNQGEMSLLPNLDNILKQHVSDWRILQNIANSFFDSIAKLVESFLPSPTIFGGISRNSILNPANLDALNEIYTSLKYIILGTIKIITNSVHTLKFVIQFCVQNGSINTTDIISHLMKGFFKFWLFK